MPGPGFHLQHVKIMVGENQQGERLGGRGTQNEKIYSVLFKTQNQRIENKFQICYRKDIENELKN